MYFRQQQLQRSQFYYFIISFIYIPLRVRWVFFDTSSCYVVQSVDVQSFDARLFDVQSFYVESFDVRSFDYQLFDVQSVYPLDVVFYLRHKA
jgi:hypothetical protein